MTTTHAFLTDDDIEILEGSLEIADDTDNLHDAIRALLANEATYTQCRRVLLHLVTDHFDYMSNFALRAASRVAMHAAESNLIR